ncbi:AhpD family alkylhydroperoxidase [Pseudacidovorax intermedius]|uniref:AhpD family alkylhydroperoxidase n=1 Tax=Pseudacidovorax intermedius TaxID=433924 RepID=A0A370FG83_9BURK|nr:carboxymuconolactone decarboxylase family protein [Pseudacidovorax intermedius]RDI24323.1 AhpD family alkylhydroperoxidase [Pseudacidovorax intermedius]
MTLHAQPRLSWMRIAPRPYQAMIAAGATLAESSLGPVLIELVKTRVSQINGCAFCLDMHVRDLRKLGELWQRINSLATWRDARLYTERERAALAWAEALTRLPDGHAGHDEVFDHLRAHFSEQEIVELSWAIAQINAWNRMAVGMSAPVPAQDIA